MKTKMWRAIGGVFLGLGLAWLLIAVGPSLPQLMLTSVAQGGSFVDNGQELGGAESTDVALGDLDGDRDLDAFVVNGSFGRAEPNAIWLNNGSGTFRDSGQALGLADSLGLALGDLDGDRDLDAFVANGGSNEVWVNNGTGRFSDSGQSLGNADSQGVALGDVDGDDDLDAVVANFSGGQVWLNNGAGKFATAQSLGSRANTDVALGDLDGDEDLDIVFAEGQFGDSNQVWWNDGRGGFSAGPSISSGALAQGVALGDLDKDGNLDIVFATSGQAAVWWNNGDKTFAPGPFMGTANDTDVALGDLDGDGDLDVFCTRRVLGDRANRVWVNTGNRTLFIDDAQALGQFSSFGTALGDVDGDKDLDLWIANSGPNKVWINDGYGGLDLHIYHRTRDQVLSTTVSGTHYISLAYAYKGEIMRALLTHPSLKDEGKAALELWQPNLQALVDGQGASVIIGEEQVQAMDSFLENLSSVAGPALQQTISGERARLGPLEAYTGKTMDEARAVVVGYPVYDEVLYLPLIVK